MTPVNCRVKHDPDNNQYGDCIRACVATVMDLDAEDVPHFVHDDPDWETAVGRMNRWLGMYGLTAFFVGYPPDPIEDVFKSMQDVNSETTYLLFGRTNHGDHVVVCKGGEIIHDPSWIKSPLIGPLSVGMWQVMVLAKS